jgi:hypothetical protein
VRTSTNGLIPCSPFFFLTIQSRLIRANLKLHDLTASKTDKPHFQVTTKTSNARFDVTFQDAPVDSVLVYKGTTSNSPAELSLHPTFEGHFLLTSGSQWFNPVVHESQPDDPSGKGRSRVVQYRNLRGSVDGDVYWGSESVDSQGVANVRTSNAKVTLNL